MHLPFESGNLTDEVKTHVPDVTKLAMGRKARKLGMLPAEYLRDLVCLDVHGATYDELMMAHRRKVRAAMQGQLVDQDGPGSGPESLKPSKGSSALAGE